MPTSSFRTIPVVIQVAREIQPTSVLDIGLGFGKYGYLLREYLDVQAGHDGSGRYRREQWNVVIDGVEIYEDYITDLQRAVYNMIHIGDIRSTVAGLPTYDLILMCDVIEHIPKKEARDLLGVLSRKARRALLITTPADCYEQGEVYNNPAERHVSEWTAVDFQPFGQVTSKVSSGVLIVVVGPDDSRFDLDINVPILERFRRRLRHSPAVTWLRRKSTWT
jgi:hypothetical protein